MKSKGKSAGVRYDLTESGRHILDLMAEQNAVELAAPHGSDPLANLRQPPHSVVQNHITAGPVWRPIEVKAEHIGQAGYLETLLAPTFGSDAASVAATIRAEHGEQSP